MKGHANGLRACGKCYSKVPASRGGGCDVGGQIEMQDGFQAYSKDVLWQ